MTTTPTTYQTAAPDAVIAVTRYLCDGWGGFGYSLAVIGIGNGAARAYCRHTDGSEFTITADRWGNVTDSDTLT